MGRGWCVALVVVFIGALLLLIVREEGNSRLNSGAFAGNAVIYVGGAIRDEGVGRIESSQESIDVHVERVNGTKLDLACRNGLTYRSIGIR